MGLLSRFRKEGKFIACSLCGGEYGTLLKIGDHYEHQRPKDCQTHRLKIKAKESILAQAKPVK